MTCVQPASTSIAAETSPVNAPFGSQWRFCAPRRMSVPAIVACDGLERGEGRGDDAPRGPRAADARRRARDASASASLRVPCIFQLPARRGSARHRSFSSAAKPGSVLPSRNSSDAPPPVETCVTASSLLGARERRDRVAAADDRRALRLRPARRRSPSCPARTRRSRRCPSGRSRATVCAAAISARVEPAPSAGRCRRRAGPAGSRRRRRPACGAPASGLSAARWSTGSSTFTPLSRRARSSVSRARLDASSSTRELPTGFPCALRNVYAIAPPMQKHLHAARAGSRSRRSCPTPSRRRGSRRTGAPARCSSADSTSTSRAGGTRPRAP